MANRQLEAFDPARDFFVRRQGFYCAGRRYNSGDAFRKSGITPRQLQQFYEQRAIGYGDDPKPEPVLLSPAKLDDMAAKRKAAIGSPELGEAIASMSKSNSRPALVKLATDLGIDVPKATNKADIARLIIEASGNGPS